MQLIESDEFKNQSRKNHEDFTRQRKLGFKETLLFPCMFAQSGLQNELNLFLGKIHGRSFLCKEVDKSAMTKARRKIKVKAYRTLNDHLVESFYKIAEIKRWNGFRVLGIDGSMMTMPDEPELNKYFGEWGSIHGYGATKARLSVLYDPLNDFIVDCRISGNRIVENRLLVDHLKYTGTGDLILCDRGYQSFWIFKKILAKGGDFCIRASEKRWKVQFHKFMNSKDQETIIELVAPANSAESIAKFRVDDRPIKVRLIKYEIKPGQIDLLCTSVLNSAVKANDFVRLYHQRWTLEENYKVVKSRLTMERFMGKSRHAVLQEFLARVFMLNISLLIRRESDRVVESKSTKRKHKCRANFRQLLAKVRASGVLLFFEPEEIDFLRELINEGALEYTEQRIGRTYERNKKVKKKLSQSYPAIS